MWLIPNIVGTLFIIYGVAGLILWLQSISVSYSWNIGTSVISLILGWVIIANHGFFWTMVPILIGLFLLFNWLSVRSFLRRLKMKEANRASYRAGARKRSEEYTQRTASAQEAEIVDKKHKK